MSIAGLAGVAVAQTFPTSRSWKTWPFSQYSPWNMPVGSGAHFATTQPHNWINAGGDVNIYNVTVSIPIAQVGGPVWNLWDNGYVSFSQCPASPPYNTPPFNNSCWYYYNNPYGTNALPQSSFCQPTSSLIATQFLNTQNPKTGTPYAVFPGPLASQPASGAEVFGPFPFSTNPWSVLASMAMGEINDPSTDYSPQIQMPASVCGSPDSDGLMSVVQTTHYAVDLYSPIVIPQTLNTFNNTNVVLAHGIGTLYDLEGDGTGLWNGRRASLIPTLAGVIRSGEIANGAIYHALAMVLTQNFMTYLSPLGGGGTDGAAVWPALGYDQQPAQGGYANCTGCLRMGALLAIPPTISIASLQLSSAAGKIIAQAAQTYGVYIVDTAGVSGNANGGGSFMAELGSTDASAINTANQTNDLAIIVKNLYAVTNSSASLPGGPPAPQYHSPLAPPFND
jgi:hypothetical protein